MSRHQTNNIDKTQVFLSTSDIFTLFLEIYTETKIKIAKISNNTNGTGLEFKNRDHNIAIIELREMIICSIRINGYVC